MPPPLDDPHHSPRRPDGLRPLTKRQTTGPSAGAPYVRSPALIAQIEAALALSPDGLAASIRETGYRRQGNAHRQAPTYLAPETLVYLVRHHTAEATRLQAESPALARPHAVVSALASVAVVAEMELVAAGPFARLSETAREKAEGDLLEWLLTRLPDTSARGDALEVSFGLVAKRRAITCADRADVRTDAFRRTADVPAGIDSVADADGFAEHLERSDRDRHLWAAIDALPDSIRIPFLLYTVDDVPVQSKNPQARTLCAELGLSSTTIYLRIHEAERLLRIALHDSDDPPSL